MNMIELALSETENLTIQRTIGETVRHIRKAAGVSQTDLGNLIAIHQTAVSRVESGDQNLIPSQLLKIAHYFGVYADDILSGRVNFNDVALRFGKAPELPPRYQLWPFSKMREFLPTRLFLEKTQGDATVRKLFGSLELDGLLYLAPDATIGVQCHIDVLRQSIKKRYISLESIQAIVDHSRTKYVQGFLHQLYESQISPINLIQTFLLNEHHYEKNFDYQIDELSPGALTLSIKPSKHMEHIPYKDETLGDFLCQYRKTYLKDFPRYIGLPSLNLIETECHFHGNAKCIYKISAA